MNEPKLKDRDGWAIYADWLIEQGDARGDRLALALSTPQMGVPSDAAWEDRGRWLLYAEWLTVNGFTAGRSLSRFVNQAEHQRASLRRYLYPRWAMPVACGTSTAGGAIVGAMHAYNAEQRRLRWADWYEQEGYHHRTF